MAIAVLLLFLLLTLLALASVTLATPVLAVFTNFLLCASILVAMLARIQVCSCVIPWLDYSVQFLTNLQVPEQLWLILVLKFMIVLN
jgi:hypothetical protein